MFEWFYLFWRWLSEAIGSDEFWQLYLNMGNWFYVVVIGMVVLYAWVVFQPFGKKVDEENLEVR